MEDYCRANNDDDPREEYSIFSLLVYCDFAYSWKIIVATVVCHDVDHLQSDFRGNSPVALGSRTDIMQYRMDFNFAFPQLLELRNCRLHILIMS
jgi:hypothetical protein